MLSRWLDTIMIAERTAEGTDPPAWEFQVRGSTVMLFGERTTHSGKFHVLIDGAISVCLPGGILDCRSSVGGTIFRAPTLAVGLDPNREHRVTLIPFDDRPGFAEWRVESICVAGGHAEILQ